MFMKSVFVTHTFRRDENIELFNHFPYKWHLQGKYCTEQTGIDYVAKQRLERVCMVHMAGACAACAHPARPARTNAHEREHSQHPHLPTLSQPVVTNKPKQTRCQNQQHIHPPGQHSGESDRATLQASRRIGIVAVDLLFD
jgi:hypothetical protein